MVTILGVFHFGYYLGGTTLYHACWVRFIPLNHKCVVLISVYPPQDSEPSKHCWGPGPESCGFFVFTTIANLQGGAPKIAKLVNIILITRTYGRYIELVNGFLNPVITGAPHLVNIG